MELTKQTCRRCDWTKIEPESEAIPCSACEWLWCYYLDDEWHLVENNLMPTE